MSFSSLSAIISTSSLALRTASSLRFAGMSCSANFPLSSFSKT